MKNNSGVLTRYPLYLFNALPSTPLRKTIKKDAVSIVNANRQLSFYFEKSSYTPTLVSYFSKLSSPYSIRISPY